MISIDQVGDHEYSFPTVDFKFQNSGNATAFLWQFAVNVVSAEVDVTPVLAFTTSVESGKLQLAVTNNGWGAAQNCTIDVEEKTLTRLFDRSELCFNGSLDSGKRTTILSLSTSNVSTEAFRAVEPDLRPLLDDRYQRLQQRGDTSESIVGIRINSAHIKYAFTDETGEKHENDKTISFGGYRSWIALARTAFVEFDEPSYHPAAPAYSDTTYISLIDPNIVPHERLYSMSRRIAPGDIERFHIMVGALKSCRLRIKFKFFVDKESVVESEEFDVRIWSPRSNSWMLHDYKDGSELARDVKEIKRQMRGDYMSEWQREHIERLESQASNFPFSRSRYG